MTVDEYLNKCLKDEGFRKALEKEVADRFLKYVLKAEKIKCSRSIRPVNRDIYMKRFK